MQLYVIAVGRRMPAWAREAYTEFNKRLPYELRPNLVEIPPVARSKTSTTAKITAEEGKRIRAAIPDNSWIIVLDEKGKQFDSLSLAKKITSWQQQGRKISFIIGGADGLHENLKKSADLLWSLSSLTLPHALVRVMVVEQVYRAWSILNNHPYHRE